MSIFTKTEWQILFSKLTFMRSERLIDELNKYIGIDLKECGINHHQLVLIAKALENNKTITTLNLAENNISELDFETLRRFDYWHNKDGVVAVTHNGIKKLANALKENKTLIALDLSENGIGDQAAREIFIALQDNRSILSINLSGNNIAEELLNDIERLLIENRQALKDRCQAFVKPPKYVPVFS